MRRFIYSLIIFILIGGVILTAYAPDVVSTVFIVLMEAIIALGVVFGILPVIQYYRGFEQGLENIERALDVQTSSTWSVMGQIEDFFNQRAMDELFREYQEKVKGQRESGQVLADIEDYINDDILGMRSWQSVITQIPGSLTGLGILGTFVGLIIGIQGIGFSSVNAALTSVQTLLSGIQIAFYTSIAGVILSLVFNTVYRIAWNAMLHNLGLFVDEFHKNVIPPVEEQLRYRERKEIKQITDLLERLPKGGAFSVASGGAALQGQSNGNEQILMPQILQGLKDGEFVFYLQPRYDLNNRNVLGAEALVRWNHGKLGMISPAVFIPILESNGYITKLDQYIWEQVCVTIRRWIDEGVRPVPITINVTKTDIMAIDIVDFFNGILKKYRIPPRHLEIDIAENAYMQSVDTVLETEAKLRESGFKVAMDGFDGNFIALSTIEGLQADVLKLDLRHYPGNNNQNALSGLFDQARKLQYTITVEGIESMEQMSMLRKCGCSEGQGFYLSKPTSVEEFEKLMRGGQRASGMQKAQREKIKNPSDEAIDSEEYGEDEKAAAQPDAAAFAEVPGQPEAVTEEKPESFPATQDENAGQIAEKEPANLSTREDEPEAEEATPEIPPETEEQYPEQKEPEPADISAEDMNRQPEPRLSPLLKPAPADPQPKAKNRRAALRNKLKNQKKPSGEEIGNGENEKAAAQPETIMEAIPEILPETREEYPEQIIEQEPADLFIQKNEPEAEEATPETPPETREEYPEQIIEQEPADLFIQENEPEAEEATPETSPETREEYPEQKEQEPEDISAGSMNRQPEPRPSPLLKSAPADPQPKAKNRRAALRYKLKNHKEPSGEEIGNGENEKAAVQPEAVTEEKPESFPAPQDENAGQIAKEEPETEEAIPEILPEAPEEYPEQFEEEPADLFTQEDEPEPEEAAPETLPETGEEYPEQFEEEEPEHLSEKSPNRKPERRAYPPLKPRPAEQPRGKNRRAALRSKLRNKNR